MEIREFLTSIFPVLILLGWMAFLVYIQPDLGSAATLVAIGGVMLFLAGVRLRYFAALALLGLPVLYQAVMAAAYRRDRIEAFLNPWSDARGSGYQVIQSKIAVGSGGIWGGTGTQTHLSYLPVPQTDFIFAAFAEEHGFVGALGVLLLYFIVLMRLTQNAQTAPDRAGTFVVMGVVAVLSFHILVNVGMVVGFMPVTGIPLPLMSYGGSSVLFMFLALGMVMNVRMRRFVN